MHSYRRVNKTWLQLIGASTASKGQTADDDSYFTTPFVSTNLWHQITRKLRLAHDQMCHLSPVCGDSLA